MLFQQITPQRLKSVTAPIHGIQLGKVGMWAAVVTPLDPVSGYTSVVRLFCFLFYHAGVESIPKPKFLGFNSIL